MILEELVDEGGELRVLPRWERAVGVTTDLGDTHVVLDTKGLVDLSSGNLAVVGGEVSKPLHVGILGDVETSWSNEAGKEMVIDWEAVNLVDVGLESLGEPDVLSDNLGGGLDVGASGLLVVGQTPAGGSSGSGLLWDSQGNTLDESTGNDSTLAVTRATSNTNSLGVDVVAGGSLKSVDDTVNTPSPCGQSRGTVSAAVESVELSRATRATVLLSGNVVVVEGDGGNASWNWNGCSTVGNDSWNIASTVSGNADRKGDGLSALGDVDGESATRERASDGRWLWWEGSKLVALEELRDFGLTTFPVGLGCDLLTSEECEWIRESRVGNQVQVRSEGWASAWSSSRGGLWGGASGS